MRHLRTFIHIKLGGILCRHHWDMIALGPTGEAFECSKCLLSYDTETGWSYKRTWLNKTWRYRKTWIGAIKRRNWTQARIWLGLPKKK